MRQQITIRVPASTSNLGPGFDCLGVALRIYNSITVARSLDPQRPETIVRQAAALFFRRTKVRGFGFACSGNEKIPRCRGLGSSATIRLGILHGLNELAGRPLDRWSIFQLCAELEQHPDNAAPCSFGGFTATRGENIQRFEISPRLKFVLLIPDFEISTPAARRILPKQVPRTSAIENVRNVAAITAAFASRNYEDLRGAFIDKLHQPFRARLIAFLPQVIAAAEKAGALGAFLSGSGSTICAITVKNPGRIGEAMKRTSKSRCSVIITSADNSGVRIKPRTSTPKLCHG